MIGRRWLSTSQHKSPYQKPTLPDLDLGRQHPEPWEK
jgi:hypothetical protein